MKQCNGRPNGTSPIIMKFHCLDEDIAMVDVSGTIILLD
jgi:hypothetical protein